MMIKKMARAQQWHGAWRLRRTKAILDEMAVALVLRITMAATTIYLHYV